MARDDASRDDATQAFDDQGNPIDETKLRAEDRDELRDAMDEGAI